MPYFGHETAATCRTPRPQGPLLAKVAGLELREGCAARTNGGGCARSMSTKPDDWLLQVASRLLAKDGVFAGFQRTLRATLEARRTVDRNVGRVLAGLNLPSFQDVERLFDHIQALEQDLGDLSRRLSALAERLDKDATHRCPHQKPGDMTGE